MPFATTCMWIIIHARTPMRAAQIRESLFHGGINIGSRIWTQGSGTEIYLESSENKLSPCWRFQVPLSRDTLCDSKRTAVPESGNCNSKCPVSKGLSPCRCEESWEDPGFHCVGSSVPGSWFAKDPADTLAPWPWELWTPDVLSVRREIANAQTFKTLLVHHSVAGAATRETDAMNKPSTWIPIAAAHARLQHCWMWWPNECITVVHKRNVGWCWRRCLMEIKLRSTTSNIIQHGGQTSATCSFNNVGWCYTNVFSGPVWPGLNGKKRKSGRKQKKLYPSKPSHSVSLQYHQFPSSRLFFKDMLWWWWRRCNRVCNALLFACTVNPLQKKFGRWIK